MVSNVPQAHGERIIGKNEVEFLRWQQLASCFFDKPERVTLNDFYSTFDKRCSNCCDCAGGRIDLFGGAGITPAANLPASNASTIAALKDDFNALLSALKAVGLMEADGQQ